MELSPIYVQEIRAEETYSIRHDILRPGRPLKEVQFDGDMDPETFHLGAFREEQLLGIATFVRNSQKEFKFQEQYQLRGMAVLAEARNMQIGKRLLQTGEELLKAKKKTEFLWCNARETAVDFYRKNGYKTHGDYFDIPTVCTHIVMYKHL